MSFDFANQPMMANKQGLPTSPNSMSPVFGDGHPKQKEGKVENAIEFHNEPVKEIIANTTDTKFPKFTISDGENNQLSIPINKNVSPEPKKKETKRKRKSSSKKNDEIVRAKTTQSKETVSGTVEDAPTIYSYMETTNMLHDTLGQIDIVNRELMEEFETVKRSRTLKNKYNTINGLAENIGSLINNRISVIKEINATIGKSNDLDYKKSKDRNAAQAAIDDDQYIANLYKSFIQNPQMNPMQPQMPQIDPSIFGSSIVRADIGGTAPQPGANVDTSYLNYLSNLSPEQNMMRYEDNPNVKQVVVYDAATGNRFFQVMDMSNGNVIPNVPTYDQMFLEDTTLDLQTGIAKNINLNETFPIVQINNEVTKEY